MYHLIALIIMPTPIPPIRPVINLKTLLLSRYSNNCVNPSITVGISNMIANMIKTGV